LPQERLSIVKIKEVLRLHSLGLKQRQIARSCSISPSTVSDYLQAATKAKLNWPEVGEWDDDKLEHALWGDRPKQFLVASTQPLTLRSSTKSCKATPTRRCN